MGPLHSGAHLIDWSFDAPYKNTNRKLEALSAGLVAFSKLIVHRTDVNEADVRRLMTNAGFRSAKSAKSAKSRL